MEQERFQKGYGKLDNIAEERMIGELVERLRKKVMKLRAACEPNNKI